MESLKEKTQFLYYKPDWPKAQKRWESFWNRDEVDRPCIAVTATKPTSMQPPPEPDNPEDIYFDPEYVGKKWHYFFESTYFGGEAVPCGPFLLGAYALGCGTNVKFDRRTVWHPILMSSIDESIKWHPGPDDPWQHKFEKVINHLLDISQRKFLVGYQIQVPVNDLLALIRGVGDFLLDMADCTKCVQRMKEIFPLWLEIFEYFRSIVDKRQRKGCVWGWPGIWSPTIVQITQSDMSCMISSNHFERYVMSEMDILGNYFDCIWYHVDGPHAIRHVPTLLTRPYIKAIQYVPGAGNPPNGPAYMDLYRRVQGAGRCLDINVPVENIEFLVRHLRPEGLILRTSVKTQEQADELLDNAVKWCGTNQD